MSDSEKLLQLRGGMVVGLDHSQWQNNRQDAFYCEVNIIHNQLYWVGVVADGCGSGKHSEVSASLLPLFTTKQIMHLLQFATPVLQIPMALYPSIVAFLQRIQQLVPFETTREKSVFVQDYLLATVIGFVINESEGVLFHAGDGYWAENGVVTRIEHDNRSPYIGYHLVPIELRHDAGQLPRCFSTQIIDATELDSLAIATDGFSEALLLRLFKESLPGPLGIQLWMNKINGPRNPDPSGGLFYDDAAVVVFERSGGKNDVNEDES